MRLCSCASIALPGELAPWPVKSKPSKPACRSLAACTISVTHIIVCASNYLLAVLDTTGFNVLRRLLRASPIIFGSRKNYSTSTFLQLGGNCPVSADAARWLLKNSSKSGAHDHV